jgi:hypothetical protein
MRATDVAAYMRCLWLLRIRAGNPSLGTLARKTDLPKSTLHDGLHLDRNKLPSLDLVRRVAAALAPEEVSRWEAAWCLLAMEHRDLKSTLELRPVFHRLEPRIRAHVLLCWLALLLIRVAERRCQTTWRRIATELGRVHTVTLASSAGTVIQTTPPSPTAAAFLAACQVDRPPRITHLQPA